MGVQSRVRPLHPPGGLLPGGGLCSGVCSPGGPCETVCVCVCSPYYVLNRYVCKGGRGGKGSHTIILLSQGGP